jgi:aminoglycoside phosphotransferase (APT) family kinase protein
MNRVIAALHSVDYGRSGLADYGKPGSYFARQIAAGASSTRPPQTEPIAEMDRLIDWLPRHIPPARRSTSQVHRAWRLPARQPDLPPHRAARAGGARLGTVHAGPPAGRLQLPLHGLAHPPGVFRGIVGLDLPGLGIPSERDYVRRYLRAHRRANGRADADAVMADWNFYLAYNLFRLAGIAQGMKRLESGTAASAHAARAAASARPLAEQAWSIAQAA